MTQRDRLISWIAAGIQRHAEQTGRPVPTDAEALQQAVHALEEHEGRTP